MGVSNSLFIKACYGRNDGPIPIWIMRQAGRYLPEYQAVRGKVSFQELCKSPTLIAEVVRQPVERFQLDAAILFSDILTILEPMGVEVSFPEGGPVIGSPISRPEDVNKIHNCNIERDLSFVLAGIDEIKKTLPHTPLIGFAGSPFTLFCYLAEGKGSKTFDKAKKFIQKYPNAARRLIELLADSVAEYLRAQVDAGVDVVQIFDSWGGILAHDDYREWSARPMAKILAELKGKNVPRIVFVNNVAPYLDIVSGLDCEVIGVDYRIELAAASAGLNGKSLQGNLDPTVLFAEPEQVAVRTEAVIASVKNHKNLIFNLGHGILPETPIASVEAMITAVRNFRNGQ
ncbi:MAG: uroporphyrinogen decarboxylase [Candidatus Zixiibacteriota bacterium]